MTKGKLIVIDGGEGTGKTSVINFLKENLPPENFIFTREPGGTPLAEEIRAVMISDLAKNASGKTQFGLIWASRSEHVDNLIIPTLESGKHIISDRFDSSTYAYQIYGQEAGYLKDLFLKIRQQFLEKCEPDLYIILDLPIEIAKQRVNSRLDKNNHFDNQSQDYHSRVRDGYLKFVEDKSHVIIDARKTLPEVCQEVKNAIVNITDK